MMVPTFALIINDASKDSIKGLMQSFVCTISLWVICRCSNFVDLKEVTESDEEITDEV